MVIQLPPRALNDQFSGTGQQVGQHIDFDAVDL